MNELRLCVNFQTHSAFDLTVPPLALPAARLARERLMLPLIPRDVRAARSSSTMMINIASCQFCAADRHVSELEKRGYYTVVPVPTVTESNILRCKKSFRFHSGEFKGGGGVGHSLYMYIPQNFFQKGIFSRIKDIVLYCVML